MNKAIYSILSAMLSYTALVKSIGNTNIVIKTYRLFTGLQLAITTSSPFSGTSYKSR